MQAENATSLTSQDVEGLIPLLSGCICPELLGLQMINQCFSLGTHSKHRNHIIDITLYELHRLTVTKNDQGNANPPWPMAWSVCLHGVGGTRRCDDALLVATLTSFAQWRYCYMVGTDRIMYLPVLLSINPLHPLLLSSIRIRSLQPS